MNPQERVPVRWMAPEVFTSQKHTPAADVWAMGVLFWEIFNNGREPYTGWAGAQVKHEILQNNYRLEMPGWAPDTVKQVVSRIWIADPAARIKSKEIYRMLERLIPGGLFFSCTDKSNPSTSVDNYRFLQTTGNDQFSSNADPADELGNKEDDSPKKRKKHKRREKTIANQADGGSRSQISRISRRDAVSRESAISREHISHRDPVSREHVSRRDKTVSREVNDGVVSRRQQLSRDLHSNRVSQYDDLSDHKSKSSGKKKKKHSRESRYSPSREQGRDRSERRDKADKKKRSAMLFYNANVFVK
uniref:Protein kinase domain-containing protein n=1 Tax=Ditylenchus dipsaci TaxID=166011 RepID=A0A915EKL9_9BILA